MRRSHEGLSGIKKDNYPLPEELKEFNYYYPDENGHVVMAIPESLLNEAIKNGDLDMFECPVPCKYVLEQGYRMFQDHVVVDCNFDDFEVDIDESYYEYNDEPEPQETNLSKFEIGSKFPIEIKTVGHFLEFIGNSVNWITCYSKPSPQEIYEYSNSKEIEFRYLVLDGVLLFLAKIGKLKWQEAPYNISIMRDCTFAKTEVIEPGVPIYIYLVESETGILKSQRLLKLDVQFSRGLQNAINTLCSQTITISDWNNRLNRIYQKYSTEELARLSDKSSRMCL